MTKSNWEQIVEQMGDDLTLEHRLKPAERLIVVAEQRFAIMVSVRDWQGRLRLDIRQCGYHDGRYKPSTKGVVVFPDQIPAFIKALQEVLRESGALPSE